MVIGGKIGITNDEGVVKIALPAGTYDVLVSAEDYVAETDTVTITNADDAKSIEMTGV